MPAELNVFPTHGWQLNETTANPGTHVVQRPLVWLHDTQFEGPATHDVVPLLHVLPTQAVHVLAVLLKPYPAAHCVHLPLVTVQVRQLAPPAPDVHGEHRPVPSEYVFPVHSVQVPWVVSRPYPAEHLVHLPFVVVHVMHCDPPAPAEHS